MTVQHNRAVFWDYFPVAPYDATDECAIIYNKSTKFNGTAPLMIGLHGHGGDAYSLSPALTYFSHNMIQFARAGWIVVSMGAGLRGRGWSSPPTDARITAAVTWAKTGVGSGGLGAKNSKHFFYGYSMGGGNALVATRLHPAEVAATIAVAPAVDIDAFAAPVGAIRNEIQALYATYSTTASESKSITGASTTLLVASTAAFPASGTCLVWNATAVFELGYTSKDATHFYGVTYGLGTATVTNADTIYPGGMYNSSLGYVPLYDAQHGLWDATAITVPVHVIGGGADATITPAMLTAFFAAITNANISRFTFPTATHTDVFQYMPTDMNIAWMAQFL